ncbi:MAG: acyl-CoA reductase [Bacteroidota bacterium]
MNLQERIDLLVKLGQYLSGTGPKWMEAKENAERENGWFTQAFIDTAIQNIVTNFLHPDKLKNFISRYHLDGRPAFPKNIGLVMAGNIPLVGFHDWLCVFLSGHSVRVKPSSKDRVLIAHIIDTLAGWDNRISEQTRFSDMLKGCDSYIATGSNNTSRYFDYYFSKYPHIIRRNRTSVALLTGHESAAELERLSDDINLYYGLGCRNVTKLYVPRQYDFIPLLAAFKKYSGFADHNKYKNNYDYQLAVLLLNNKPYMTNGALLLVENEAFFSAISQLHYGFYTGQPAEITAALQNNPDIQCVIGRGHTAFGQAQYPHLEDFADGVDTMQFLTTGLEDRVGAR